MTLKTISDTHSEAILGGSNGYSKRYEYDRSKKHPNHESDYNSHDRNEYEHEYDWHKSSKKYY